MISEKGRQKFLVVLFIIFLLIFLIVNDVLIMYQIREERAERILSIQEQMKNLQSRINLNALQIDSMQNKDK